MALIQGPVPICSKDVYNAAIARLSRKVGRGRRLLARNRASQRRNATSDNELNPTLGLRHSNRCGYVSAPHFNRALSSRGNSIMEIAIEVQSWEVCCKCNKMIDLKGFIIIAS